MMTGPSLFVFVLSIACIGLTLAASLHDIVARTVPNSLSLILAVAGSATAAMNGYFFASLLAAGSVFIVAALCWRGGLLGGGDVKLLGAVALAMPPHSVLTFVAAVAIAGGLLALLYLVARLLVGVPASLRPVGLLARVRRVEAWRIRRGGPLPYACAIAAGFIFVSM